MATKAQKSAKKAKLGNAEVGDRIRKQREFLNMTQAGLAEKLGISVQSLSKIERGESDTLSGKMALIAKALHISADYLYFGETAADQEHLQNIVAMLETLHGDDLKGAEDILKIFAESVSRK